MSSADILLQNGATGPSQEAALLRPRPKPAAAKRDQEYRKALSRSLRGARNRATSEAKSQRTSDSHSSDAHSRTRPEAADNDPPAQNAASAEPAETGSEKAKRPEAVDEGLPTTGAESAGGQDAATAQASAPEQREQREPGRVALSSGTDPDTLRPPPNIELLFVDSSNEFAAEDAEARGQIAVESPSAGLQAPAGLFSEPGIAQGEVTDPQKTTDTADAENQERGQTVPGTETDGTAAQQSGTNRSAGAKQSGEVNPWHVTVANTATPTTAASFTVKKEADQPAERTATGEPAAQSSESGSAGGDRTGEGALIKVTPLSSDAAGDAGEQSSGRPDRSNRQPERIGAAQRSSNDEAAGRPERFDVVVHEAEGDPSAGRSPEPAERDGAAPVPPVELSARKPIERQSRPTAATASSGREQAPLVGSTEATAAKNGTPDAAVLVEPVSPTAEGESSGRSHGVFTGESNQVPDGPKFSKGQPGVNSPRFLDRLAQSMHVARQNGQQLRVRLHPPELGTLQISVSAREGTISAQMEVQTTSAQQAILENLSLLRDALSRHGTPVQRIDVQLVNGPPEESPAYTEEGYSQSGQQEQPPREQHGRARDGATEETSEGEEPGDSAMDELDIAI